MKNCFVTLLIFMLLVTLGAVGAAEGVSESITIYEDAHKKNIITPDAYDYIIVASVFMGGVENNRISIIAETRANQSVDLIEVTAVLQRFENGIWKNVDSTNESNTNSSRAQINSFFNVQTGHIYRLSGFHRVEHQGDIETGYTYTQPTYID